MTSFCHTIIYNLLVCNELLIESPSVPVKASARSHPALNVQNCRQNRKWRKTLLKIAIDIDFDLRNETKNILRVFGASIVLKLDYKKPIKWLNVVLTP